MKIDYLKGLNYIQDNETKKTIKRFVDSLFAVERNNVEYCSSFMTPKELGYAISALKNFPNINYSIIPNIEKFERNCIVAGYNLGDLSENKYLDYIISKKTGQSITHRDVLGAILSLGINREKIGDIIISNDEIIIVVINTLTNYIIQNLLNISRYTVDFKNDNSTIIDNFINNREESIKVVSSLRVDNIIAEITNSSRKKTNDIIKNGRVKINYEEIKKNHIELKEQDTISIKNYGRFKLLEILGQTKKDKFRIKYEKYL